MSKWRVHREYLLSDRWQVARKRALERAGYRCQCGLCPLAAFTREEIATRFPRHQSRLEVHHLTYDRLGAEAPDDLIVLCGLCHGAVHGLGLPDLGPMSLREVIAGLPIQGAAA